MKSSNKIKVGKVIEAKGLRGEVKVLFFSGEPDWLDQTQTVYLASGAFSGHNSSQKNKDLPATSELFKYQIEKITRTSQPNKICFKFKGVDDRNAAESLESMELFVDSEILQSAPGENVFLGEMIGFEIFNVLPEGQVNIGKIVEFETNGNQDLAVVMTEKGEKILVPLIQAFIEKIDFDKKRVVMNLPEGLLEINLAL